MNTHLALISAIKSYQNAQQVLIFKEWEGISNQELIRRFFRNYRSDSTYTKGLWLTAEGLIVMKTFFKHWVIRMPDGYVVKSLHILYLDNTCTLPWFLDADKLILFEADLAMKAKLVGDLNILMKAFTL